MYTMILYLGNLGIYFLIIVVQVYIDFESKQHP